MSIEGMLSSLPEAANTTVAPGVFEDVIVLRIQKQRSQSVQKFKNSRLGPDIYIYIRIR